MPCTVLDDRFVAQLAPENGWLEYWDGLFSGVNSLLVSGRVYTKYTNKQKNTDSPHGSGSYIGSFYWFLWEIIYLFEPGDLYLAILLVTFLGWCVHVTLLKLLKVNRDLQLGDKKVHDLNHLVFFIVFSNRLATSRAISYMFQLEDL